MITRGLNGVLRIPALLLYKDVVLWHEGYTYQAITKSIKGFVALDGELTDEMEYKN
jgi:hypothetical protein